LALFGFERPQFVEIEVMIPKELQEIEDDVRNLPLPHRFHLLSQPGTLFAFVHLRKAGGTSIRWKLDPYLYFKAGNPNNSYNPFSNSSRSDAGDKDPVMISACGNVKCATYQLDEFLGRVEESRKKEPPIWILGHFSFGELEKVTSRVDNHTRLDCLTQLRHPIDRTLSCFYYRGFEEQNKTVRISSFKSEGRFRKYMSEFRDIYGYGCNNEMLRMFTSEANETFLSDPLRYNKTHARELVQEAKRNIVQCVVFLTGRGSSRHQSWQQQKNKLIGMEFFPEFAKMTLGRKDNVQMYPEDVKSLHRRYYDVMYDQNELDLELYEFGVRWHQRLYRFAARNKLLMEEIDKIKPIHNRRVSLARQTTTRSSEGKKEEKNKNKNKKRKEEKKKRKMMEYLTLGASSCLLFLGCLSIRMLMYFKSR